MTHQHFLLGLFMVCSMSLQAQNNGFSFEEQFDVDQNTETTLLAFSEDGDISVWAHDASEVKIQYVITRGKEVLQVDREGLAELVGDNIRIDVKYNGNTVDVRVTEKDKLNWFRGKKSYNVDLLIYVPERTSADLKSSDGDIVLQGLTSKQTCNTSDGDVEIQDIEGDLYAKTSDGDIKITNIAGSVEARTSDGDIEVNHLLGNLNAKTLDGDIDVNHAKGEITTRTSDGDITLTDVDGIIKSRTNDGDVIQRGS